MALLPSNKNSGLRADKVTSSWRRGPSSLHGSHGSTGNPAGLLPSLLSNRQRSNAKWHESGGGVNSDAWLHLNAYAMHKIEGLGHDANLSTSRAQSMQGFCATMKKPVNQRWSKRWTWFTGQQAVQQRFHNASHPPWRLSVPASAVPRGQSGSQASVWI